MGIEGRDQEGNWVATARKVRVKSWEHGIMEVREESFKKSVGDRKCFKYCQKV